VGCPVVWKNKYREDKKNRITVQKHNVKILKVGEKTTAIVVIIRE